ncbi:MAG: hypothetical protein ACLFNI_04210 [Natronomonas sp.]
MYRFVDECEEVVRFDYGPEGEQGHEVTIEGVHMSVYRENETIRSPEIFSPMPTTPTLTGVEEPPAR